MKKLKNKFEKATDFSFGKAFVNISNCEDTFCINKKGEVLFKTKFEPLGFNHANQTIVRNKEFLHGVINSKGQIIIPCIYDYIYIGLNSYTLEKNGTHKHCFSPKRLVEPAAQGCEAKDIQPPEKGGRFEDYHRRDVRALRDPSARPPAQALRSIICLRSKLGGRSNRGGGDFGRKPPAARQYHP